MIITDLTILNLRSHRNTEITGLQSINWFVGQNYSGKSTILDALSYLFRGVCRGTDEGGKGAKELVATDQHGKQLAESFRLEAKTDHGTMRRVGPGHGPRSNVQLAVDKVVDAAASRVIDPRLLISNGLFLNLDEATQRKHVTALLAPTIDVQEIITIMGEEWQYIEELGLDWSSPSHVDQAERHARSERKSLKDRLSMVKPFDKHAYPEQVRGLGIDEARTKLINVKSRLAELRQKSRTEADALGNAKGMLETLQKELAHQKTLLSDLKWTRQKEASIDAVEKQRDGIDQKCKELAAELPDSNELASRIFTLENKKAPKGKKASCWVCDRAFAAGQKEKLIKQLKAELKRAEGVQVELKKLVAQKTQLTTNITHWKEVRRQHGERSIDIKRLTGQLADSQKDVERLEKQEKTDYSANIEKGETVLATLQSYVDAMGQRTATDDQVRSMRTQLNHWERCCELLAPKGPVRASIIGGKSAELVTELNETAGRFGMQFTIEFEPFRFLVNGRKPSLLSNSEQLRAGMAFQVAAAKMSGLNFACIDNVDMLDTPGRSVFTKVIRQGIIGQLFVAATLKVPDEEFRAPKIPGWRFYLVKGGPEGSTVEVAP
jgi:hypothetical protein